MTESDIFQYLTETFADIYIQVADENSFIFYGAERYFPFATLMVNDINDTFSDLNRPSIYRLNIGVSKETFLAHFGTKISRDMEEVENLYDFTVLDRILPHPVYGRMYWLCILNPSNETFENHIKGLLTEAYQAAVNKQATR